MLQRRINPNGGFEVWQMGALREAVPHASITADTYYWQNTTGAVVRIERVADAPPVSLTDGVRLRNSMKITVISPAVPAANQVAGIVHTGTSDTFWKRLLGRRPALTYYMKASGPFVLSYGLRSNAPFKTFTCRAEVGTAWGRHRTLMDETPDTDWGAGGPERGYANFLFLGGGGDFLGALNQWSDGPTGICIGHSNFLETAGNTLWIAGHQLEADAFTPFEQRSHEDEEWDCMRFIQKSFWRDVRPQAGWASQSNPLHAGQHSWPASRPNGAGGGWQGVLVKLHRPMAAVPQVNIFNPVGPGQAILNWSRGVVLGGSIDGRTEISFRLSAEDPYAAAGDTLVTGWCADASVVAG